MALKEKLPSLKDPRKSKRPHQPKRVPALRIASRSKEATATHPAPLSAEARRNLMICVLLSVSTVILYFPVSGHPFINFDDNVYVTANSHVNSGLNWNNFKWAWTTTTEGNWHPLTWLSHQFDCQLFGLNAGAHHFVNLLLHCSNTLLVFLLLNRSTRAKWQSAMVAALFALHPLNVESVAWVAELKNLLCTFFFLLALGAYGWYAQNPQVKRYLSVFALFAMGLASKPMVITLPFVLLLIDFWPLGRVEGWTKPSPEFPLPQQRFSRLLLEKLPLFVLSAASAIITVMAQRTAGAVASLGSWTITLRLENAIHSYAMYFWRAFLPMDLALYYPALYLQLWEAGLAAVSLLAVSWVVYRFRAHHPYVVMGWLWFLGTLIPVIGLIQIGSQSMADRYAYIPLLGLFIAVVWAVADIAKSTTLDQRWLIAAAAVVLSAFSLITARQLHFWKSSEDLWAHTLHVTTNNFVAEEKLGNALRDVGRDDEALPHFFNAVEIQPDVTSARLILGESLLRHGRYSEAMEHLDAVVRLSKDPSDLCDAYDGLGIASAHIGDRARARQYFVRALQLNSGDQKSLYNLSLLETQEGIEKLSAEVSSHPTPVAYSNLGELFERVHKTAEAKGAYEHALRLNPNLAEAKLALQTLESTSQ